MRELKKVVDLPPGKKTLFLICPESNLQRLSEAKGYGYIKKAVKLQTIKVQQEVRFQFDKVVVSDFQGEHTHECKVIQDMMRKHNKKEDIDYWMRPYDIIKECIEWTEDEQKRQQAVDQLLDPVIEKVLDEIERERSMNFRIDRR